MKAQKNSTPTPDTTEEEENCLPIDADDGEVISTNVMPSMDHPIGTKNAGNHDTNDDEAKFARKNEEQRGRANAADIPTCLFGGNMDIAHRTLEATGRRLVN